MKSGADWLGTFYEVFLKYARWAQDLGIVLTPRHITRFAARVQFGIGPHDIVFDPTCGTGGFLVAAFEEVKRLSSPEKIEEFKRNSVFGLEQDDGIAALVRSQHDLSRRWKEQHRTGELPLHSMSTPATNADGSRYSEILQGNHSKSTSSDARTHESAFFAKEE